MPARPIAERRLDYEACVKAKRCMKRERNELTGRDEAPHRGVVAAVTTYLAMPRGRILADVAAWATNRTRRKAIRFRTSGIDRTKALERRVAMQVVIFFAARVVPSAWASFEPGWEFDQVCQVFHARMTTDVEDPNADNKLYTDVSVGVNADMATAPYDIWMLHRVRDGVSTGAKVRIPETVIGWVARGDQDTFVKYLWRRESHLSTLPLLVKRTIIHCGLWGEPDSGDPPLFPEDDQVQSNRTH